MADQTTHPDAKLISLGKEMERLYSIERAHHDAERWDEYEAVFQATNALVDKIESMEAHTMEGLKIKARAVLWCHSNEPGFSLVCDQDTTDLRLATQIVAALAAPEAVAAE